MHRLTTVSIGIEIMCKRGPHPHHQARQLNILCAISKWSKILLGVAKYKGDLDLVSENCSIEFRFYFTSEKWLIPIEVVVLYLGASHLYEYTLDLNLLICCANNRRGANIVISVAMLWKRLN